jgi:hypothetical protein
VWRDARSSWLEPPAAAAYAALAQWAEDWQRKATPEEVEALECEAATEGWNIAEDEAGNEYEIRIRPAD